MINTVEARVDAMMEDIGFSDSDCNELEKQAFKTTRQYCLIKLESCKGRASYDELLQWAFSFSDGYLACATGTVKMY